MYILGAVIGLWTSPDEMLACKVSWHLRPSIIMKFRLMGSMHYGAPGLLGTIRYPYPYNTIFINYNLDTIDCFPSIDKTTVARLFG